MATARTATFIDGGDLKDIFAIAIRLLVQSPISSVVGLDESMTRSGSTLPGRRRVPKLAQRMDQRSALPYHYSNTPRRAV
jgi:hypothetical protein